MWIGRSRSTPSSISTTPPPPRTPIQRVEGRRLASRRSGVREPLRRPLQGAGDVADARRPSGPMEARRAIPEAAVHEDQRGGRGRCRPVRGDPRARRSPPAPAGNGSARSVRHWSRFHSSSRVEGKPTSAKRSIAARRAPRSQSGPLRSSSRSSVAKGMRNVSRSPTASFIFRSVFRQELVGTASPIFPSIQP